MKAITLTQPWASLGRVRAEIGMSHRDSRTLWVIVLLAMVPYTILTGWTTAKLWEWFVVPTFGLPSLGILQAIGIHMVARWLTSSSQYRKDTRTTEEQLIWGLMYTPFACGVALAVGAILRSLS